MKNIINRPLSFIKKSLLINHLNLEHDNNIKKENIVLHNDFLTSNVKIILSEKMKNIF